MKQDAQQSRDALCYLHASNINFEAWRVHGAATSQGDRDEEKCLCFCRRSSHRGRIILAAQQQPGAEPPAAPMGFFVTSTPIGDGANLGGLQGADAHCQKLAAASGQAGAGERVWRAYLSTQGPNAVNARDRIGSGPWANARGGVVARDVAHLHGDTVELAQVGSNLSKTTAITEKATPVLGAGDMGPEGKPMNQHDILTGSTSAGRAFPAGEDRTCNNWTSNSTGAAQVGHFDRTGGGNASWNSAHPSKGCSQPNLVSTAATRTCNCFAER